MQYVQAHLEELRADAAECKLISDPRRTRKTETIRSTFWSPQCSCRWGTRQTRTSQVGPNLAMPASEPRGQASTRIHSNALCQTISLARWSSSDAESEP